VITAIQIVILEEEWSGEDEAEVLWAMLSLISRDN
jgi:hypothetical protein